MRDAVIFDMDGTTTNVSSIRHLLEGKDRNFHAFHRASVDCPPNEAVIQAMVECYEKDIAILIVTARLERYWPETQFWLRHHVPVPWTSIWMRQNGDYRKDSIIKREILAEIREAGYNVVGAYDDNPAVVEVWVSEGIPTVVVPGWTEL